MYKFLKFKSFSIGFIENCQIMEIKDNKILHQLLIRIRENELTINEIFTVQAFKFE